MDPVTLFKIVFVQYLYGMFKAIYDLRKETIERVFGDVKEKHGMRYTHLRGLLKVKMQVALTFTCMNLKKIANWKYKNGLPSSIFLGFFRFLPRFLKKRCSRCGVSTFLSTVWEGGFYNRDATE